MIVYPQFIKAIGFAGLLLCGLSGFSQLPASGDLRAYIGARIDALPSSGTNVYSDPKAEDLTKWSAATEALLAGNVANAHTQFTALGYRVVVFSDTGRFRDYHIIEKVTTSDNYWGSYVIDLNACRSSLIIQSPHPVFDTNTGDQGVYTFLELEARAFFLSGTHRCNSSTESSCSGSTTACGSSGPFRISDPAHNSDNVFQKMTEILLEDNSGSVFMQLHGFGKQVGDPNAILSNGSRLTPQRDYISELLDEMAQSEPSLTFKTIHKDLDWSRLTAFTNTQGRFINGSALPCTSGASSTTGQFIHVEQELPVFRSGESGWSKWIGPMGNVFDCEEITPLSGQASNSSFKIYPNPFRGIVSFWGSEPGSYLEVYDASSARVLSLQPADWKHVDLSDLKAGIYLSRVLNPGGQVVHIEKLIKQ